MNSLEAYHYIFGERGGWGGSAFGLGNFLGHEFLFVTVKLCQEKMVVHDLFWRATACLCNNFFYVKHRTWMVEALVRFSPLASLTCVFPQFLLCRNIFGNCPNYPERTFILPVTAPSSKKIAHLFPVSFQVPALKISTRGY